MLPSIFFLRLHPARKLSRVSQEKLLVLFLRAAERNEIVGHEYVSILRRRVLNCLDRRGKHSWPEQLDGVAIELDIFQLFLQ